ncbi:site-specific DNA-methyltransferase [Rodentibacter trehalosifermentans]|nr:site-specific DNA-methyltransferase [Rodentibacter trehalosifermentans]
MKNQQLLQLKSILPEIFCENQIDFDKFKQLFADEITLNSDRYMLNWPGKSEAYKNYQIPTTKTLTPCVAESVDFENTQNIFIEGENLDVLKALQKSYFNSIKMIYIDPPYNTGNDFVYRDNFADTKADYAEKVGDLDEEGKLKRAFVRNRKENGHYHSNWLNMMLPRLHLAKNLLTDDGVIFISIDDNEQAQLKLLCDEVFGEENFVADFIWDKKNSAKGVPPRSMVVGVHEYILCYGKNTETKLLGELRTKEGFSNPDNDPRGEWRLSNIKSTLERGQDKFKIIDPDTGREFENYWAFSASSLERMIKERRIIFPKNDDGLPKQKEFFNEFENPYIPLKSQLGWYDPQSKTEKSVEKLMGSKVFLYRKPLELMKLLVTQGSDDLILDFFSGSGTTAHAVMQLNAEDNGNRRFICVQLPEQTDEKSEAFKAGFKNIAEISKGRIRRAGSQILQNAEKNPTLTTLPDVGFKVFKLTESHFKQWRSPTAENLADQLEMFIDAVGEEADTQAMLYEILLRLGLKLTAKVRLDNNVFWVEDDKEQIFALMLAEISEEIIENVIDRKPKKVVTLDRLFDGNDALKKNTELQMKDADITFFVI